MRILIVRLSAMGDIVHALPLALNARLGGATVAWLADRRYGGLLAGNPSIERLFLADTRRWRRNPLSPSTWKEIADLRKALREFEADATLDAQGLWKSALLARLSGAPVVGFSSRSRREPSSAVLLGKGIDPAGDTLHVVDQNLSLLDSLGLAATRKAPDAGYLLAQESPAASAFVKTLPAPFALYHPGAAQAKKTWGESNYARLASRLHQDIGLHPVISWGPGDEKRAERLADLLPTRRPSRASICWLAAVASRASLFVAGDTGPLHLADARRHLPRPSARRLTAATRPNATGPTGAPRRVTISRVRRNGREQGGRARQGRRNDDAG
jgi:lipopolysaccharide heptosyltransferase I